MSADLFSGIDQRIILVLCVLLLFGSAEIGFRAGRNSTARLPDNAHPHVGTIEGALLGLLALLLGFAFSMAMTRFDDRSAVVVDEANDLQTTYLRARLLPVPQNGHCRQLLQDYVDSRIEFYRAGSDAKRIEASLGQTLKIQSRLWAEATAAVQQNTDEVSTGYFIQSLNGLIDDHTKRVAAMENHVPEPILWLLIFVACMTVGVTGYSSGLKGQRLVGLRLVLATLVAATLLIIIDLDRPRRGMIVLGGEHLVNLRESLQDLDGP